MEYAVRLASPTSLPQDPRRWCPESWWEWLPEGPLKAVYFGSEFCQDLIPAVAEAQEFCALAAEADLEAVLLTPLVRAQGLEGLRTLLSGLAERGMAPTVVFNDFGVLQLLRESFPQLRRQAGRLINRALRDPRLVSQSFERPAGQGRGGEIRRLLRRYGVAGLETDTDLDGSYLGDGTKGLRRVLHLPYVFAASGRNCLVKAVAQPAGQNFAAWLDHPCSGPCRTRCDKEIRTDLDFPLWRAGNALFYESPRSAVEAHLGRTDRVVVHPRPMP